MSVSKRVVSIDAIKTLAIVLMIFFHTSYDLNLLKLIQLDLKNNPFWYYLPRVIVALFFFAAGQSLYLAHNHKIKWNSFLRRQGKLLFCSLVISVLTYFLFPQSWVYFGTLHSIFLCSWIALAFVSLPQLAAALGLLIILPSLFTKWSYPWILLSHLSMDYIPPFPWVGVMLLGVSSAHFRFFYENDHPWSLISWSGRHSLAIYLLHQPIIFGLLSLYVALRSRS